MTTPATTLEKFLPLLSMENDFRGIPIWRNSNCKEEVEGENFRHFCKICRRRFTCGRALGGHMRIHGAAAEKSKARFSSDGDLDKNSSYALRANRKRSWIVEDRSYAFLAPDANRSMSFSDSGACAECGKEFSSWRAMLQHMRYDHTHSQFSGFCSDSESLQEEQILDLRPPKGKRTKRVKTWEDPEDQHHYSPSNSVSQYNEEEDMAKCLVMLSSPNNLEGQNSKKKKSKGLGSEANAKGHYQCKTCGKVFSSFQALGGHRASHKNLKGCSSKVPERNDSSEEEIVTSDEDHLKAEADCLDRNPRTEKLNKEESASGKARLHECSICRRNFPSGQALGGHKRCHWTTGEASVTGASSSLQKTDEEKRPHGGKLLDLNLPAPADDEEDCKHFEVGRRAEPKNIFVGCRRDYPYHVQPWWDGKSEKGRSLSCHDQTHVDDEAESEQKVFG